jgi:hypothetical protein
VMLAYGLLLYIRESTAQRVLHTVCMLIAACMAEGTCVCSVGLRF